jgi:hypothetical protein
MRVRVYERFSYFLCTLYYLLYLYNPFGAEVLPVKVTLLLLLTLFLLLSYYYEGVRLVEGPFVLGLTVHLLLCFFLPPLGLEIITIFALVCLFATLSLIYMFGESDMSRAKMTGEYEVGYKEYRVHKMGTEISVYYPVMREAYNRMLSLSSDNNT